MKKTPVWQIILLVVLLGGLGFAMFKAFSGIKPASPPPPAQQAAGSASPAGGDAPEGAVDMPEVVPTTSQGRLGEDGLDAMERAGNINPNLFKVYQVQPPKNPFVEREEWYASNLEQIPGYPELSENDYFDSMDVYLPDIGFIYDDPNGWDSISVTRSQDNQYNISGFSEDGSIQTQISLEKDIPTRGGYTWHKGSKVPLANLQDPEWIKEQIRLGKTEAAVVEDENVVFDEYGLPIPGGLSGLETTTGSGDSFACFGVSVKGSKTSALMMHNGSPRIVTEGMVLPTHYEVLEINQDGVVIVDVKTGFSSHVPLGGSTAADL